MPKYYEDKEEDNRACAGLREDFKACLLQHDCVLKEGKKPSECVKEGHCRALQVSFFECKRSMVGPHHHTDWLYYSWRPEADGLHAFVCLSLFLLLPFGFSSWTPGRDSGEERATDADPSVPERKPLDWCSFIVINVNNTVKWFGWKVLFLLSLVCYG
uniref:Cytochrome c oxidase assembly factor 5 n=1 Tax=Scleropages formosus TaxID=113540 RepID=A0A8C9RQY7_SCLFO